MKAGEILIRQRGTEWHAGENVKMGVDHTLYATEPGWVRFYSPVPEKSSHAEDAAAEAAAKAQGRLSLSVAPQASEAKAEKKPSQDKPIISPMPMLSISPIMPASRPHPTSKRNARRYVGIVLTPDGVLPSPRGAPTARRFAKVDINKIRREETEWKKSVKEFVDNQPDLGAEPQAAAAAL